MYTPLGILSNVALVGGSILLFCAPFILYFFIRHRKKILEVKPGFNQFMERFFESPSLNWLVFAWAVAEALIWFVIPEFLLFLVVFMKIRHRTNLLIYDILGTIVGTIVGLTIHVSRETMLQIPYVYEGMFTQVHDWFKDMGVWGLIHQPFSGVPYKVFLNIAPEYELNLLLFLILAIVLRVGRYAIFYVLFWLAYPALHKFVYKHYAILLVVAVIVFSLLLMKVSTNYTV